MAGACSDDQGSGSGSSSSSSLTPNGSTGSGSGAASFPGGAGGSRRSGSSTAGEDPTTATTAGGDPSAGIPQDLFCRGYAEVQGSEQAIADAVAAKRLADLKTAYQRLTDAYLAMAENPPDEVYDAIRAVAVLYDDLGPQVQESTSLDELKGLALRTRGGEHADDLKAVRDYGTEHC